MARARSKPGRRVVPLRRSCANPLIFVAGRRDADAEALCTACSASFRASLTELLTDWTHRLSGGEANVRQGKRKAARRRFRSLRQAFRYPRGEDQG